MPKLMIACFALLLGATPVRAGFVANYTGWNGLSQDYQSGYVAGLIDWFTLVAQGQPQMIAVSKGLSACGNELEFRAHVLADAITDFYKRHTDRWVKPPVSIFWDVVVRGVCLSHVNRERATLGLNALEKAE